MCAREEAFLNVTASMTFIDVHTHRDPCEQNFVTWRHGEVAHAHGIRGDADEVGGALTQRPHR